MKLLLIAFLIFIAAPVFAEINYEIKYKDYEEKRVDIDKKTLIPFIRTVYVKDIPYIARSGCLVYIKDNETHWVVSDFIKIDKFKWDGDK